LRIGQNKLQQSFNCHLLGRSPELFDFVTIKKQFNYEKESLIIYPDPPLGLEEMMLLKDAEPEFEFVTPINIPNI